MVGRLPGNVPIRLAVRGGAAEGQGLGLGDQVGDQQVVVDGVGVVRPAKPMKSAGTTRVPWCSSW